MLNYPNFKIPSSIKYLGDVINTLPENCIFNKVVAGCGATTIALTNDENYIIAVPYVSLVENKVGQLGNVFGVYEKTKIKELKDYLRSPFVKTKKIIVTYDSLFKVLPYIETKDYKLMIDEMHILFSSYVYRQTAVRCVLEHYQKFKSFCFVTATLTEPEFLLKELQNIPIYEADWETVKEVQVESIKCDSDVIHTTCFLIESFLNGEIEGNAHIFVNSVEFIKQVIKNCNLNEENTKAIWSLHNKIPMPFGRGKTLDKAKKINFYTSTCFEGCDIYDTEGKIYIISDGKKSHTLVDISTSFQQIVGRLRKTKYWNTVTHIHSSTRYSNPMTYEEYKKFIENEIKITNEKVKELNNISDVIKSDVLKLYKKSKSEYEGFINTTSDSFYYDENLMKLDLFNFKITKSLYKIRVNLTESYQKQGFSVIEIDGIIEKEKEVTVVNPKNNFKETVEECKKDNKDFIKWAFKQYDFLKDALTYLGYEEIERLDYHITKIRRQINNFKCISDYEKIKAELKLHYKITNGVFLSNLEIKEIIQTAYKNLKFDKKAKSKDILKYFKVEEATKSYGSKKVYGYNLLNTN